MVRGYWHPHEKYLQLQNFATPSEEFVKVANTLRQFIKNLPEKRHSVQTRELPITSEPIARG
jgi:hypothetical protein